MPSIRAPVSTLRPEALKVRRHDPYAYDVLSSTRAGYAVPISTKHTAPHVAPIADDNTSDCWTLCPSIHESESLNSTASSTTSTAHEIRPAPVNVSELPAAAFLPPESLPHGASQYTPSGCSRTPSFGAASTPSMLAGAGMTPTPKFKIAIVAFKFGTRSFRATFRVAPGDAVVVEWDNGTTHLGFVEDIVEPAQVGSVPSQTLLRRARDGDMRMYETARLRESAALCEAQRLVDKARTAGDISGTVTIMDIEWQLDSRGVTLVAAFSSPAVVDRNTAVMDEVLGDRFACDINVVQA